MNHRPVAPDQGLVIARDIHPPSAEDDDLDPAVCRVCLGPVRICGGAQRCTTGALPPSLRAWMTAMRLVYVGVCVIYTPASLWGGAMLRLARRLVRGVPSSHLTRLALEHADPGGEDSAQCAALAIRFLAADDSAATELYLLLRPRNAAPWLRETVVAAKHAAEATPIGERLRFPLFTVLCDGCASRAAPRLGQFAHVGTYDEAIRCPGCLLVHRHPIRGVTIGAPHPVGRCLPDPANRHLCMVHEADGEQLALDAGGLCSEGRQTMTQAEGRLAEIGEPVLPADRALAEAVRRAKDVMPAPFVEAVRAMDPGAAEELERIGGFAAVGEYVATAFEAMGADIREAFGIPAGGASAKPKALGKPPKKKRGKGRSAEGGT